MSKNHQPLPESTSKFAMVLSTAADRNAVGEKYNWYAPVGPAVVVAISALGTAWPDARPSSVGHAYRLTVAPGTAIPAVLLTVPLANGPARPLRDRGHLAESAPTTRTTWGGRTSLVAPGAVIGRAHVSRPWRAIGESVAQVHDAVRTC